jgi:hypothetical protein
MRSRDDETRIAEMQKCTDAEMPNAVRHEGKNAARQMEIQKYTNAVRQGEV